MHAERRTAEAVPYVGYARAAVSSTLSCHGGVHSVGVDGRGQAEAAGHLDELAGGGSALVAEEVHHRRRSSPSRARPPGSRGTRCPRSRPPRRGNARKRCSAGPCPRRGSCRRSCSRARRCALGSHHRVDHRLVAVGLGRVVVHGNKTVISKPKGAHATRFAPAAAGSQLPSRGATMVAAHSASEAAIAPSTRRRCRS